MVGEPMEQYRRIKPLYKDALLVLRDHAGYLMLYNDARKAAQVLELEYAGNGPFRIAKSLLEGVLDRLVAHGHRVAVVIDPAVDDPANAKQVDLWDVLCEEGNVMGEPMRDYVTWAKAYTRSPPKISYWLIALTLPCASRRP